LLTSKSGSAWRSAAWSCMSFFFFKQKTAYEIHFQGALASASIATLVPLASGIDTAGTHHPFGLLSNGLAATVTVDGQDGSDQYTVNNIGGATSSLINVFDSGGPGFDALTVN